MKTYILSGIASIILAGLAHGQADDREMPIGDFERLEAGGRFNLVFEPGASPELRLSGDPDDIDDIEIEMRGNALKIRQHRGIRRFFGGYRNLDVTIHLSGPSVQHFEFSRGVDADLAGIEGEDLALNLSTGADVDIAGTCGHATVNVSTGADLDGREFDCRSLRINASTGSDAVVIAHDSLVANVSTGADVRSLTEPTNLRVNSSTGGDVHVNRDRRARRDGRQQDRQEGRHEGRHEDRESLQDGKSAGQP
jgi:hypothetical protein